MLFKDYKCVVCIIVIRVVHGCILCDLIQRNPSADWPNPSQPNTINNGAYIFVWRILYTELISYF